VDKPVQDLFDSIMRNAEAERKERESVKTPLPDRFVVMSAREFQKRPRPEWIIKGVLPRAELAAVVASYGVGKSPLLYSMGAAISRGVSWYGHKVKKGRAVYLVAEGAGDFRNRVEAYSREFAVSAEALPEMIDDVPNLATAADAALIAKRVGKADVIFIDTFAASFAGDENSGKDVGPVLTHAKFIHRQTGALIVFAMHPGHNDNDRKKVRIRGWSGIISALDTEITIAQMGADPGATRHVEISKQKGGTQGALLDFKIKVVDLGPDADGDPVTSVVLEEAEPQREPRQSSEPTGKHERAVYDRVKGGMTDLDEIATSATGPLSAQRKVC